MSRIYIDELPLDVFNQVEILSIIDGFIQEKTPHQIVTLNSMMYIYSQRDPILKKVIQASSLVVPDSIGICLCAYLVTKRRINRITGIDLLYDLCRYAEVKKYRIYLLGAKSENVKYAAKNLIKRFPGLILSGYHNGYFSLNEESEIIREIKHTMPDILFVGLDVPRQEKWISQNLIELNVPLVIGVGGSFDVISGELKRAPKFLQKIGLEWLFRIIQEPSRIKKVKFLPLMFWYLLKNLLKN